MMTPTIARNMGVLLDRPFQCPKCRRPVRQLYPLTDYDKKSGKWVNGQACLACCGPEGPEPDGIGSQFRARKIQR